MIRVNENFMMVSDEIRLDLHALGDAIKPAMVRRQLIKGAVLIRDAAQRRAPYDPNPRPRKDGKPHFHVKESIFAKGRGGGRSKYNLSGMPAVMTATGFRRAPHGHLIEFGTKPRYTKKGAYRGVMPANPFFWPGLAAVRSEVGELIDAEMWKLIERAWKRKQ